MLDNSLLCSIAKGISAVMFVVMVVATVCFGIAAIAVSAYWMIGFFLCAILSGLFFGVSLYLFEEY